MSDVILHIGTAKTGTTSIQHFLRANSNLLLEQGFDYPADRDKAYVWGNAHFPIAAALSHPTKVKLPRLRNSLKMLTALDELRRDIDKATKKVILSCEHLSFGLTSKDELQRLASLFDGHNVRVLVYLRNQADYSLSSYATSVLHGNQSGFEQPIEYENQDCEYYLPMLRLWADVFGRKTITVRPYETNIGTNSNIVDDFCQAIGIEASGFFYPPRDNVSLGLNQISILRLFNSTRHYAEDDREGLIRDQRIRKIIAQSLDRGPHLNLLLDPKMRDRILRNHAQENLEIAENWFQTQLPDSWNPRSSMSKQIHNEVFEYLQPENEELKEKLAEILQQISSGNVF